jgi:hypothetical protein
MEAYQDGPAPLTTPAVNVIELTLPPPAAHRDRPYLLQPMRASHIVLDVSDQNVNPIAPVPAVNVAEPTPPPPVVHRDYPYLSQPTRAFQIVMDDQNVNPIAQAASTSLMCYELSWS